MAGIKCVVNSGAQVLEANTVETILQLVAASNQRVVVNGFSVTVAGTSPVDLTLELVRQTSAGTSSAATAFKLDDNASATLQTSCLKAFSAEPTADATPKILQYKKLQGSYEKYFPMGQELIVPANTRLGLRCTATAIATVAAEFYFEE